MEVRGTVSEAVGRFMSDVMNEGTICTILTHEGCGRTKLLLNRIGFQEIPLLARYSFIIYNRYIVTNRQQLRKQEDNQYGYRRNEK